MRDFYGLDAVPVAQSYSIKALKAKSQTLQKNVNTKKTNKILRKKTTRLGRRRFSVVSVHGRGWGAS